MNECGTYLKRWREGGRRCWWKRQAVRSRNDFMHIGVVTQNSDRQSLLLIQMRGNW